MKIAVITPHFHTPASWLDQCRRSVKNQTLSCTHFLVNDGDAPLEGEYPDQAQVIQLPQPHEDVGNAARAIGSIAAICQGFDALAYLDADNWYESNHLESLAALHQQTGAAVCTSARNLHHLDGTLLGPCPEVDGDHFVDTNCLFLTRAAFEVISAWYLMPSQWVLLGDRFVWQRIREMGLSHCHSHLPTVAYRTSYKAHYEHFGRQPPPGAKETVHLSLKGRSQRDADQEKGRQKEEEKGFVGEAAKPVASVSLCLIVKDGESGLERCLKSAADLVQEIIVVDTGSSDRSPEIARECGARVFDFPWQDSFAAARNESIHHATGDWIFWLDADEYLDEDNRARLGRLLAGLGHDNAAYIMKQRSPPNAAGSNALVADQARLFPNHPQIRWQYRVHEQILPAVLRLGGTIHWTDIFIQHGGYEDATLRHHKHERNLRLLELEVQEHPDDAFTLFNLGWTYLEMGRAAEAIPLLRRSLERTPAGGTTIRKQYALLAKAHRKLGQPEEALAACREGRTHFPEDIELLHQEGLLRFERGDLTGAEACLVRLLESRPENYFAIGVDPGLRGYQTWYKLGIIYRDQGKLAAAEAQWRAVLAERPEHAPAWIGLTDLLLSQGRYQEVEEMARRLDQEPARILEAALIRGRLYLARREFATARALLEDLIPKYPQAVWLRVVLSHVLLREDRDPAATERALRGVLALDPANAQARDNLAQLLRQAGSPGRDFKGQPAPV